VGLVVDEFEPAPELRGVVHRAVDFHERAAPLQRLESPLAGVVLIVSLGPDMEIDGRLTGSFVAGVWDRPTVTGHQGEQAGYQLYLDLLGARRVLGIPGGELGNRMVDLEDVLGAFGAELIERVGNAADAGQRHAVAQRLLAGARPRTTRRGRRLLMRSLACAPPMGRPASRRSPPRSAGAGATSPPASTRRLGFRRRRSLA
jgi:hypothetical protein